MTRALKKVNCDALLDLPPCAARVGYRSYPAVVGGQGMQLKTATLSAVQPPSDHIHGLLKSLVKSLNVLPDETNPVHASNELPPTLQKVVASATGLGHRWAAWRDAGPHVWLYVGQLSRLLSHRKGSPVLQVKHYRETGLVDTCNWVIDRHARWLRWEE